MSGGMGQYDVEDGDMHILNEHEGIAVVDRTSIGRGRCVISRKAFNRGDIVLQEDAAAFVVLKSYSEYACAACAVIPENGQIFGVEAGDPQRYCTERCMNIDRDVHSFEAQALSSVRALGIDGNIDACNLIMRVAANRKNVQGDCPADSTCSCPLLGR